QLPGALGGELLRGAVGVVGPLLHALRVARVRLERLGVVAGLERVGLDDAVARPERLALVARLDGRLAALGARDALAGRDLLLPARPRGCGPALEIGLGLHPRRILGPGGRRLVGGAHAPRPELVDDVAALERG